MAGVVTFAPEKREMYKIKFNFEQQGLEPKTIENVAPGQSILEVALINEIDLHHNCGGVCACSTCHLYVNKGEDQLEELSDREEDFIDRAVNPRLNSRLGCQCLLLDGDGEIEVTLPDQTQFLGE
jgi:ferredoxin, 2Fe-2S